jgi:hypothetical protein
MPHQGYQGCLLYPPTILGTGYEAYGVIRHGVTRSELLTLHHSFRYNSTTSIHSSHAQLESQDVKNISL